MKDVNRSTILAAHNFSMHLASPKFKDKSVLCKDMLQKLGDKKLLGIRTPQKYGGNGEGYVSQFGAVEAISYANGNVGLQYFKHSSSCLNIIAQFGSEDQRQRLLPILSRGKHLGSILLNGIEPIIGEIKRSNGGFDALNINKSAVDESGADVLVAFARTSEDIACRNPVVVIIDKQNAYSESKNSKHSIVEDVLENNRVFVADNNVVSGISPDFSIAKWNASEKLVLSALPLGVSQSAIDSLTHDIQESIRDRPIYDRSPLQLLSRSSLGLSNVRENAQHMLTLLDGGIHVAEVISNYIMREAVDNAHQALQACADICDQYGYGDKSLIDRRRQELLLFQSVKQVSIENNTDITEIRNEDPPMNENGIGQFLHWSLESQLGPQDYLKYKALL